MEKALEANRSIKTLHLDITWSGEDLLKASLSSQSISYLETLRSYEEKDVSFDYITSQSRQMLETLNQANRNGRLSKKLLQKLKETGQLLRDELLTPLLKEKLNTSNSVHMTIGMDEQLVHIPWELLYDGEKFLCQQFAVGRVVRTKQQFSNPCNPIKNGPLKMLILSDLNGTLPEARKDGADIRNFIESQYNDFQIEMRSANVSSDFLRSKIRNYDWLHFAGHADYDDCQSQKMGWRLSDGWLSPLNIMKMAGTGTMPALVFANACQSARTEPWVLDIENRKGLFGLVNAFLLAGTQHYVGTQWEIPDEPGKSFALAFYRSLVEGSTVGFAVRDARKELIEAYGEEQVAWASYLLYGNPIYHHTSSQNRNQRELENDDTGNRNPTTKHIHSTRSSEMVEPATDPQPRKKIFWPIVAILISVLFGVFWLTLSERRELSKNNISNPQQALKAYHERRLKDVLALCPPPESGSQPIIACMLLRANVLFMQGDLEGAERSYNSVQKSTVASKEEISEAWIGSGRISAIRGNHKEAIEQYEKAAQSAPRKKEPLIALAMINEHIGNDREAINFLNRASGISLEVDPAIHAMQTSLTEKLRLREDADRMGRIDRLIDELTVIARDPKPINKASPSQNQPVGVWVINMKVTGHSLQEGAPQLMTALIESCFQGEDAFKVVDRHLMNETLSELKINSSELMDQKTRLQLGRLQSARLMVDGRIVFLGPEAQVTLRCIDTETSQVVSIVVKVVNAGTPLSKIAQQTTEKLIKEIHQNYSL